MTVEEELDELREAVLDFQRADYNTYDRPLRNIRETLYDETLAPLTTRLTEKANLDELLSSGRGGSMVGSHRLNWPEDKEEEMGMVIHLISRGADDPSWFLNFTHQYFYADQRIVSSLRKFLNSVLLPFLRAYSRRALQELKKSGSAPPPQANSSPNLPASPRFEDAPDDEKQLRVFVVHGHDNEAKEKMARFLETLELKPIILHEQANRGLTLIEKFNLYADVAYAVVLLTPDDFGRAKDDGEEKPRARQNVIFELGYFIGRLGRENVAAFRRGDVEIPSDYLGVVWNEFDNGGGWKLTLAKELAAIGFNIDLNRVS